MKPVLLDLFCGAGGCAKGYKTAGFTVVGVDILPQPRYAGDVFIQGDALEFLAEHGVEYDAIHASPPCQGYSVMNNLPWLRDKEYPLLILPTMELLEQLGKPYVLENVMGAKYGAKGLTKRGLEAHGLKAGWLCGRAFGLPIYRHRLFATNWFWLAPGHPKHQTVIDGQRLNQSRRNETAEDSCGLPSWLSRRSDRTQTTVVAIGHAKGWRLAAAAMGIDWMRRGELTQAIPPVYTEWLGQLLRRQTQVGLL